MREVGGGARVEWNSRYIPRGIAFKEGILAEFWSGVTFEIEGFRGLCFPWN